MGPSMSKRYLGRMSARVAAGANNLVRLWSAKRDLIGPGGRAFDADLDLQLANMVSLNLQCYFRPIILLRFPLKGRNW